MHYIDHHPKKLSSSLDLFPNPEARGQSTTKRDQRFRSHNSSADLRENSNRPASPCQGPAALPPTRDSDEPKNVVEQRFTQSPMAVAATNEGWNADARLGRLNRSLFNAHSSPGRAHPAGLQSQPT